jgi:hypothetical protein
MEQEENLFFIVLQKKLNVSSAQNAAELYAQLMMDMIKLQLPLLP